MKRIHTFGVLAIAMAVLAGGSAMGQAPTNYWTGATSSDFNAAGNWSAGIAPASSHFVVFTNVNSATPVQLSANAASWQLQMLNNPRLTFDLNGRSWTNIKTVHKTFTVMITDTAPGVLTFSSSAAGGAMTVYNSVYTANSTIIGRNDKTTIRVNNSLGYPVVVKMSGSYPSYTEAGGLFGNIVVSGLGSEFRVTPVYYEPANPGNDFSLGGKLTVTNQGCFGVDGPFTLGERGVSTVTALFDNAFLKTGKSDTYDRIGGAYSYNSVLTLTNNSSWTSAAKHVQIGGNWSLAADNFGAKFFVDHSTFTGRRLAIGDFLWSINSPGWVQIANGSTVSLTNGVLITDLNRLTATNTFILSGSTLNMGGGAVGGGVTNRGIMRLDGTITGLGTGRALVYNQGVCSVASRGTLGNLALGNGNLTNAATGTIHFDFSATANDQIAIGSGGAATVGGTVNYALMAGFTPAKLMGKNWDFVRADSIRYTATDNMAALMTAQGMTLGVDYNFGVVTDGAVQALRLRIFGAGDVNPPTWLSPGVSNVTASTAMGYATLGGSLADAYLFWDTADKGTSSPGAWGGTNFIGADVSPGVISGVSLSGLTGASSYYYRFYGTNTSSGLTAWSTLGTFITGAITVTSTVASVSEIGPGSAQFTVYRPLTATNAALTVAYSVAGSATPSADYTALSGSVTIPAGLGTAMINVTPRADFLGEGNETVLLTILPGGYVVGTASSATVTIVDRPPWTSWINAAGGSYATSGNWDPAGPPLATDTARFGLAGAYTVAFDTAPTTTGLIVNAGTVTFNLNGNTYKAGKANGILVSNATLIVSSTGGGGTLTPFNPTYGGPLLTVKNGSTLRVQNGASVSLSGYSWKRFDLSVDSALIVDGNGSTFTDSIGWGGAALGTVIVTNGGSATINGVGGSGMQYVADGAGSVLTVNRDNGNGNSLFMINGGSTTAKNGGRLNTDARSNFASIWAFNNCSLTIGNGVGMSTGTVGNLQLNDLTGTYGGAGQATVNAGGVLRALGQTTIGGKTFSIEVGKWGTAGAIMTLNGGTVEICVNSALRVDKASVPAGAAGTGAGLLRGAGTISRATAGVNFAILSESLIRVGDTTATPAIGTLAVNNGNLTNTANGTIYFDFSATAGDQIAISGGTATIAGALTFTNAPGFTPVKGMGKNWDFVRADSISYTGTDNMTALLSSKGLANGVDYTFGVVTDGAVKALRLKINSPAGTVVFIR
jgi:hypothetical protein